MTLQLKPSAKGLRRNHAHWCLGEEDCLPADICLGSEPESHSVAQLKSPWLLYQASITYTKTHRKTFLYLATWVLPICLSIDDGLANLQFTVNPEGTQFQLRPFLLQSENYAGNFWEMCPYWGHQGRLTSLPPTEDPKGSQLRFQLFSVNPRNCPTCAGNWQEAWPSGPLGPCLAFPHSLGTRSP